MNLAAAIGLELQDDLGNWIQHQYDRGVLVQGNSAQEVLETQGIDIQVLHQQWNLQRTAQLSIRARKFWDTTTLLVYTQVNV